MLKPSLFMNFSYKSICLLRFILPYINGKKITMTYNTLLTFTLPFMYTYRRCKCTILWQANFTVQKKART